MVIDWSTVFVKRAGLWLSGLIGMALIAACGPANPPLTVVVPPTVVVGVLTQIAETATAQTQTPTTAAPTPTDTPTPPPPTPSDTPLPPASASPASTDFIIVPTNPPPPATGFPSSKVGADGMPQILIPAGVFLMGNPEGEDNPQHQVYLDAYYIDQTEVTNAMYSRCVAVGVCTAPKKSGSAQRPNYFGNAAFDDFPVINVNWEQAETYCQAFERGLPTEAQWEKAARGTNGQRYPWGDMPHPTAALVNIGNFYGDTKSVQDYLQDVSPYNVLGMGGNVQEWVADWFADDAYTLSNAGINPAGPPAGDKRVLRGSDFAANSAPAVGARVAARYFGDPNFYSNQVGFRCAEPVKP